MKTLLWLHANELPSGGIAAWPGKQAYPEVTGYLIPTLGQYGYKERELALRCAEWLVKIQHPCGGFESIDGSGILHTFDTAAALEGLQWAATETGDPRFAHAVDRARDFIGAMLSHQNRYSAWVGTGSRQYCMRINGIMGVDPGMYHINGSDRAHFIAYALEGYLNLGYRDEVRGTLEAMPFRPDGLSFFDLRNWQGAGNDIIATAQLAILKIRVGLDAGAQIEAVRRSIGPDGGVPQALEIPVEMSWGAKFYLDMERLCIQA